MTVSVLCSPLQKHDITKLLNIAIQWVYSPTPLVAGSIIIIWGDLTSTPSGCKKTHLGQMLEITIIFELSLSAGVPQNTISHKKCIFLVVFSFLFRVHFEKADTEYSCPRRCQFPYID